jgi:hypothetical protein
VLDDVIENAQDLITSVTLSKQRKNHGLGHNKEAKCSELFWVVYSLAQDCCC